MLLLLTIRSIRSTVPGLNATRCCALTNITSSDAGWICPSVGPPMCCSKCSNSSASASGMFSVLIQYPFNTRSGTIIYVPTDDIQHRSPWNQWSCIRSEYLRNRRGQLVKTALQKKKSFPTHLRIGRPSEPNGVNAFLAPLAAAM